MSGDKNAPAPTFAADDEPALADAPNTEDVDMRDEKEERPTESAANSDAPREAGEEAAAAEANPAASGAAAASATVAEKPKARRKSGVSGTVKKLNKKGSKVKILHLDAKPGDHYFVKLRGYPQWPVVVCSEDMLPQQLIKTRPVSAARTDGSYREDFADGGKRVADRTYPVMYLQTNEFGWVSNQDLRALDPDSIKDSIGDKMRKDLQEAYSLAAEQHPLDHYKEVLVQFEQEKEEIAVAKATAAAAKKSKKTQAASPEDEGISGMDVIEHDGKVKSRKRKAEDDGQTSPRAESVKKPKIKLTTTSKAANGASMPKGSKEAGSKTSKNKVKKPEEVPKEPVLTPEERHQRKEKEVLFLRHKLQRGLLTRDHEPQAKEMVHMSEYLTKLEGFPDLEVSIIKKTKINKVLKAILKLESIPRGNDFKFKPRSQVMLEKWNKLLAADAAANSQAANGVIGSAADASAANGVKQAKIDEGSSKMEKEGKEQEVTEDDQAEAIEENAEIKQDAPKTEIAE